LIVSVGLALAAARPAGAVDSSVAVERGFAAYKSALERRDGARAASAVSANSLAYYDRVRQMALTASREELSKVEGTERMLALGMRHQAPAELLATATPAELLAYAVSAGLVTNTAVAETELGEVSIEGERARAWIVVDGEPMRGVLQFVREDGLWKFDLEFAMRSSSGLIAALAQKSGLTEDAVIFQLLSQGTGKPVAPEIWIPPAAD
jgi:hypothetical protein